MEQARHTRHRRYRIVFTLATMAFLVMLFINISLGSISAPIDETLRILFRPQLGATVDDVIWKIRLPPFRWG